MNEATIDLRSDFVSRPTPAMVSAMVDAAAKPSAFGLREDPIQRRLEARAAELLGKEDALFCPTCTMANQIAIRLHCPAGRTVVARNDAHVATTEAGSAELTGAVFRGVAGDGARMAPEDVAAAIGPETALLVVENTHVRSGGRVMPLAEMRLLRALATARGIPVHLDGSRVFNAAAALGVTATDLAEHADTVSVSLNKGLAAPMGAVLAGPRHAIEEATRLRTIFGGAWRPAQIPAAAALVGLETMVQRIHEDHVQAAALGRALAELDGIEVDCTQVESNIVLARMARNGPTVAALLEGLERHGIRALAFAPQVIRLVVWWGIGATEVARTATAFAASLNTLMQGHRHG